MKRLTEVDRYWAEDAFWYDAKEPDVEDIDEIYNRLAAIEDILGDDYELDRLKELIEADKENRCLVLPYKIGDTVWRLYDNCEFPGMCGEKRKCVGCEYRNLFIEDETFNPSMLNQNGELKSRYYTTQEEAEKALKARE